VNRSNIVDLLGHKESVLMACHQANHALPVGMSMFALGVRVVTAPKQTTMMPLDGNTSQAYRLSITTTNDKDDHD